MNPSRSAREWFDQIERAEVGPALAQSAFAMNHCWDGKSFDPPATEQPGVYAWGEAHLLGAYVLQYEATNDPRYLDTFVRRYRLLLSLRDDRANRMDVLRHRVLPSWGSVYFSDGQHTCWIVHAGMLTYPAAHFLRLCATQPDLRARYAKAIAEFTRALEETVAAFDADWHDGPEANEGYYTEPFLEGKPLPTNQQNSLGRTLLALSVSTGNACFRERAERLAHFLKRRLLLREGNVYDWAYWPPLQPPFDGHGSEDISHASVNVDFSVLCHQNGIVFQKEDIERFANTFLNVVRGKDRSYAECVNGTGRANQYRDVIGLWGNLACARPEIARLIHEHCYGRKPSMTGPVALLTLAMLGKFGY